MYLLCWIAADQTEHWLYCALFTTLEQNIHELMARGVLAENIKVGELMEWELQDEWHATPVVEDSVSPGCPAVDPTRVPDLGPAG